MLLNLVLLVDRPFLQKLLPHRTQLGDEKFFGIVGALKLTGFIFNHIQKGFESCTQGRMFAQSFFQALFLHD